MKKAFFPALLLTLTLASCVPTQLYYWGGTHGNTTLYEELAYQQYDKQSPEAICNLVCLYEDMIAHPGGQRQVPPPGICAEYGYLLLQPTTAEYFAMHATNRQRKAFETSDFGTFFAQRGEEMLAKEMELYPESAKFIEPLLRRVKGGNKQ